MQKKRKTSSEIIELLTKRSKKKSKEMVLKIKEHSIKLPNLNKYVWMPSALCFILFLIEYFRLLSNLRRIYLA